jgi:hypothetical protein
MCPSRAKNLRSPEGTSLVYISETAGQRLAEGRKLSSGTP